MSTNLKAKLLQHFAGKKANGGFTLIELLVVIIIIGILSAIALPAFLNQAAKAKQSEAKQTLGALNRGQQAHRLENPIKIDPASGLPFCAFHPDRVEHFYCKSHKVLILLSRAPGAVFASKLATPGLIAKCWTCTQSMIPMST